MKRGVGAQQEFVVVMTTPLYCTDLVPLIIKRNLGGDGLWYFGNWNHFYYNGPEADVRAVGPDTGWEGAVIAV